MQLIAWLGFNGTGKEYQNLSATTMVMRNINKRGAIFRDSAVYYRLSLTMLHYSRSKNFWVDLKCWRPRIATFSTDGLDVYFLKKNVSTVVLLVSKVYLFSTEKCFRNNELNIVTHHEATFFSKTVLNCKYIKTMKQVHSLISQGVLKNQQ